MTNVEIHFSKACPVLSDMASLNSFAQTLVDRAAAVAWQWTVLVVVLALPAHWLLRSHAPALRYWIWQIVLIKLMVMPFWTYALPVPWWPTAPAAAPIVVPVSDDVPSAAPDRTAKSNSDVPPPEFAVSEMTVPSPPPVASSPPVATAVWVVLGWSAIVMAQVVRLALQRRSLSRLLARATPAGADIVRAIDEASNVLGLLSTPRALLTAQNVSPFVCGTFRPTLVMPAALTPSLTAAQLRQVLLHELAHVRRRDLLWGWIPQAIRMLWFFHPVVHLAVYRLRLERELACDQLAMTLSGKTAADYAQTLVDVVTQTSTTPPLSKEGQGGSRGKPFATNANPASLHP